MGLRASQDVGELRKALEADLGQAEKQGARSQEALGLTLPGGREKRGLKARGIRLGKEVIGKAELDASSREFEKVIDMFIQRSGLTDQQQVAAQRRRLQKEFNKIQIQSLEAGLDLNKQIAQGELRQQERGALFQSIAGASEGIGQGIAFGLSGKPSAQRQASGTGGAGGAFTAGTRERSPGPQITPF